MCLTLMPSCLQDELNAECDAYRKQDPTGIFSCIFPGGSSNQFILPSRRTLRILQAPPHNVKNEKASLRHALSHSKRRGDLSWLDTYRAIESSAGPASLEADHGLKLDFDQLIDFVTAFHTLENIVHFEPTAVFAETLHRAGFTLDFTKIVRDGESFDPSCMDCTIIDNAKLVGRNATGFLSCTCDAYTHYQFCIHSIGAAKVRGLIKCGPPTLDSIRIGARTAGQLPNIQRGGALGRN